MGGPPLQIALATCSNLPDWEVDDQPLHRALEERGVAVEYAVWDDSSVDWGRFDACLIRTTWDYAEKQAAYTTWARAVARQTRLFNDAEVVAWNTDKSYLLDLAERGVATVPTVWLERGTAVDIAEEVHRLGWTSGFLKPVIGSTARETLPFLGDDDGVAEAQAHADRLLRSESLLLQPYLSAVETEGEYSAIYVDGELSHSVRKIPVPGDYRVQDDFGADDEPYQPRADEMALAAAAVAAAPPELLYARVDWLHGPAGEPLLVELELVEPSMFFRHCPEAAERLVEALLRRLR